MSDLSGNCNDFSCEENVCDKIRDFFSDTQFVFPYYRYGKSRSVEKIGNSQLRICDILKILICSDSFFHVVN